MSRSRRACPRDKATSSGNGAGKAVRFHWLPIRKETGTDTLIRRLSKRLGPVHIIPLSFLAAILIGTLLLMLPPASSDGRATGFLTACFTSTTSVCVTGLVVVDTFAHWSSFGQVVILVLIQLGGFGVVSAVSLIMLVSHRKFSLKDRKLLQDALNLDSTSGVLRFLRNVVKGTLLVEGFGAFLYSFIFIPAYGWGKGIWFSVFHAVSAFCNAGIDILGPDSLISYASNRFLLGVTMILIVLGGLGYVVWFDILSGVKNGFRRRYSFRQTFIRLHEHTRLVLILTFALILAGAGVIFLAERTNPGTIGGRPLGDQLYGSLFQSVTFRTAGFAAVPQENLTDISCLAGYLLMFIGGSPVGTAGGIKTVTFFLVIMNAVSYIGDNDSAVIFRRRVSEDLMRKAAAIALVSLASTLLLTTLLIAVSQVSLKDALYEICSALATVGLSRGLTQGLTIPGKWIVLFSMYLGRIGPISMALFFTRQKPDRNRISFAEGRFYVG